MSCFPPRRVMGLLVNPTDPVLSDTQIITNFLSAAKTLGVELHIFNASTEHDFDTVFTNLIAVTSRRARDQHRSILHEPKRAARDAGGPNMRWPQFTKAASSLQPGDC